MCGIIGLASSEGVKKWSNRRDYLRDGLFVDAVRGMHSTGLMLIPSNMEEIAVHKKAMNSADFLDLSTTDKYLQNIEKYHFVIGHNRHATKGSITNRMAHPFKYGKITLVHNGTLYTQGYMPDGLKFTSDSACIANAFNELSPAEVIPQLDGAFALVWHDSSDDTLHMVRNKERPISFAIVKDQDTLLIASESKMLEWLADRNDLEIDEIYEPGPGHEIIFQNKDFINWTSEQHKLRKKKVYQNNGMDGMYNGNGYVHNYYNNQNSGTMAGVGGRQENKSLHSKGKILLDLADLGLSRGLREELIVNKFVPYSAKVPKATAVGYLECSVPDLHDDHIVTVHGIRAPDWIWAEGSMISAVIQSAFTDDEDSKLSTATIVAADPRVSVNNTFNRKEAGNTTEKK